MCWRRYEVSHKWFPSTPRHPNHAKNILLPVVQDHSCCPSNFWHFPPLKWDFFTITPTEHLCRALYHQSGNAESTWSKRSKLNQTNITPKQVVKGRGFKIVHLNIRSFIDHMDEFPLYRTSKQFDIIRINETWLDNTISDHEIAIQGYNIVWRDSNGNIWGVALYVRELIKHRIRNDLDTGTLEAITVEILKT